MPFGAFINVVPPGAFIAIHTLLLLVGAYLAFRSYGAGASTFGLAFVLYALAELFYLTYHLDVTVILFAHTVAEVLNAVAFVMLFTAGVSRLAASRTAPGGPRAGAPVA